VGDGSPGSPEAEGEGGEGFLYRPKQQVPRFTCNRGDKCCIRDAELVTREMVLKRVFVLLDSLPYALRLTP
jgi:hypothetical protein